MTVEEVLDTRADTAGDCWIWTGTRDRLGYGILKRDYRPQRAHRIIWEALVGPIPPGLEIDHLCFNPPCVNPDHLRVVTSAENLAAKRYHHYAVRSHCKNGHEYTEDNTRKRGSIRVCRACAADASRRYKRRQQRVNR